MANKSDKTVTRIKASGAKSTKSSSVKTTAKASKKAPRVRKERQLKGPLGAIVGYVKGAWYELRQVHWPTRSATWGLTIAVLGFSAFFVVFILLADAGFKYLFELILK